MFKPEDKVFAKVRGYPFWPAKITALLDETPNKVKYSVYFYGSREVGVCKGDDVCDYVKNREKLGHLKRKFFPEAMREIEEELKPQLRRSVENVATVAQKKIENVANIAQKKSGNVATIAQKSKPTTPRGTPKSAKNKVNESMVPSSDGIPVTATPPQEVVSRSGRKIKPKKFSDEMVLPSPRVTKTSQRGKSLVAADTPTKLDSDFDMTGKLDTSVGDTSARMRSVTSELAVIDSPMGKKTSQRGKSLVAADTPKKGLVAAETPTKVDSDFDMADNLDVSVGDTSAIIQTVTSELAVIDSAMCKKTESTPDALVKTDSTAHQAMESGSAMDDSMKENSAMDDSVKAYSTMDASAMIDPTMELDKMNSTMDLDKIDSAMDLDKIDSAMEMDKIDLEMELAKIDAEMELSKEDTAMESSKMDAEMESAIEVSANINYAMDKSSNADFTKNARDGQVDKGTKNEVEGTNNEFESPENEVRRTENEVKGTDIQVEGTESSIVDGTNEFQTDTERIAEYVVADVSKSTPAADAKTVTDDAQEVTGLVSPAPDSSSRKRATVVFDVEASTDVEIAEAYQNGDTHGQTVSAKLAPSKKRKTDNEIRGEKAIVNGYGNVLDLNGDASNIEKGRARRRESKKATPSRWSQSEKSEKENVESEFQNKTKMNCCAMEEAARLELKLVEASLDLKRNMMAGKPNFDKASSALDRILSAGMNKYALLKNYFVVDAVLKMTNFDVAIGNGNEITNLKVGDENETTNLKVGDENETTNLKVGDENEITNLKASDENEITNLKVGDENETTKLKVGDENEITNLKVGDENETTKLKVGDENEITNLNVGDENEIPNLKVGDENETTNLKVGDKNEITNLKVGDENDITKLNVGNENEIANLKEQATLIREKAKAVVSKMKVLFDADGENISYFVRNYRVAREAHLVDSKTFQELDFYRLLAGQKI